MELIFEKSIAGRKGFQVPLNDVVIKAEVPAKYRRLKDSKLPEASELDVIRHVTRLSQRNAGARGLIRGRGYRRLTSTANSLAASSKDLITPDIQGSLAWGLRRNPGS